MNSIQTKSRSRQLWNWLQTIAAAIDYDPRDYTLSRVKALEQEVAALRAQQAENRGGHYS